MNYEQFRVVWHEALAEAGLMSAPPQKPSESIDLESLSRVYKINVALRLALPGSSFYVSASLDWHWDALQAARSMTREEDVLTELMGRKAYEVDTVPPWLRISLTLRGGPPLDSPIPMPEPSRWRRWATEVTTRIDPFLPIKSRTDDYGLIVLSARSEPEAQVLVDPSGQLFLTAVELSAWQGIDLPREWDNPDRPADPDPEDQLVDFAGRVRRALQVWEQCLPYLHSA